MAAASGKDQAGGIAGKHRTGVHVAAVGTHQLVHVPVAGVGNPAVQGVIPGGGVVRVDAGFIQIGAEGIVVGTRVCVQGIVAHHQAIALGDVVLQLPVSLAGNIRLLVSANAPGKAVHAIVAFRVYQVAGGIAVETFAVHRIDLNVCTIIGRIMKPSIGCYSFQIILINGAGVRYESIQHGDCFLVLGAGGGFHIMAVIVDGQVGIGRDVNGSTGGSPLLAIFHRPEINGLAVPLGQHFQLITVGQVKAIIGTNISGGETICV